MCSEPTSRQAGHDREIGLFLGVDGGGTKTLAVITDADGRVLGEGTAGPSNPLRVGVMQAAMAIREAIDRACRAAGINRAEIAAAQIGLAGVRRKDLRERMRESLTGLGIDSLHVVTDADIALFGAAGGGPGVVIIAGTGSICCGKNARGRRACTGGWGPVAGDEGSGSWVARRALQAVAKATDQRGPQTALVQAAYAYFGGEDPDELSTAIYAPEMTNDRIAGFARYVIEAAHAGDAVARAIIADAGRELGTAAITVIRRLQMQNESFPVAYVGGVFAAGDLILVPLGQRIARVAPKARLTRPEMSPAVAAARMAREHLYTLVLAG
ncbi:MAG: ATPase [Pyrinomonas sp.]|uniref:BadF/BadG/BcrA/BcrD ATPase family protein n=1 Tax=Pyrinomonas sp. TaxID=2080306 RepID=UPI00332E9C47